jgi:hypothetical protein
VLIMARTFTCNEEIIVVSKGTEDIGKLAMLGNEGKFDPSVIPSVEKQAVACRVARSIAQSIPDLTVPNTTIVFDTVDFDSDNMYSIDNPSRIVVPSDGVYQIFGQVVFNKQGAAGARSLHIVLNGSINIGSQVTTSNGINTYGLNAGNIYKFKKGDYVEMKAYQVSGGALDVISDNSNGSTSLAVCKISE